MHVLFVCTGNICRSPTAERLAIAYGERSGITGFTTSSAGTRAVIGHPIHDEAARVLSELGGDASSFAARQVTPRMAEGADLILTMTAAHRDSVLERAPRQLRRTFTMSEAARLVSQHGARDVDDLAALRPQLSPGDRIDVADPIGRDSDVFAEVGARIAELLDPILELCRRWP
ncbi:low molecular weight phosphatase family protein [Mycolicibacterium sp. GCM10028919]|uniref:arsenate reductase/protein-tyrosine-phosphatase family protein n=1 Tax=Mycolicibacterium sp. GCM10028919 TaxID=3273401 RepID=UPI003618CD51